MVASMSKLSRPRVSDRLARLSTAVMVNTSEARSCSLAEVNREVNREERSVLGPTHLAR